MILPHEMNADYTLTFPRQRISLLNFYVDKVTNKIALLPLPTSEISS